MSWTLDNLDLVAELTLSHIRLSVVPIVLSFVIAVPLGWVANRNSTLRAVTISAGSLLYTLGLFLAVYAYKNWEPTGALLWGLALLPAAGALAMVAAMARLLIEEQDEYLRLKLAQSALFGTGALLVLATIWGFLEQFRLVPHVPAWAAIPVFVIAIGVSRCLTWARA